MIDSAIFRLLQKFLFSRGEKEARLSEDYRGSSLFFFLIVSLFVGRMGRRCLSPICGAFTEADPNNGPAPLLSPIPVTIFTDILAFRQTPGSYSYISTSQTRQ